MSYKDEIEQQLEGVPHDLQVAFAARSALRVLPLLATKEKQGEAFWYWGKEDKAKHFLAVLMASYHSLWYAKNTPLKVANDAFAAYTTAAYSYAAAPPLFYLYCL